MVHLKRETLTYKSFICAWVSVGASVGEWVWVFTFAIRFFSSTQLSVGQTRNFCGHKNVVLTVNFIFIQNKIKQNQKLYAHFVHFWTSGATIVNEQKHVPQFEWRNELRCYQCTANFGFIWQWCWMLLSGIWTEFDFNRISNREIHNSNLARKNPAYANNSFVILLSSIDGEKYTRTRKSPRIRNKWENSNNNNKNNKQILKRKAEKQYCTLPIEWFAFILANWCVQNAHYIYTLYMKASKIKIGNECGLCSKTMALS